MHGGLLGGRPQGLPFGSRVYPLDLGRSAEGGKAIMSNRRPNPDTLDRARPRTSKSLHVIPCSEPPNTHAVKARLDRAGTEPEGPVLQTAKTTPLTPEQQKLVEDMETRWVDLDWNQPPGHPKRRVLEVPKVVFEEAYRYGPPAAGARPRHPRYVDMLLAGAEAVIRAARTFDPEFGDGNMDFAEYARRGVRSAVAEQLNDRLVHVPRKRQKGSPREKLVSVELWEGLPEPVTTWGTLCGAMMRQTLGDDSFGDEGNSFSLHESRTKTRSRRAEKFQRARATELQAPTEETIAAQGAAQEAELRLVQAWAERVLSAAGLTPGELRALILRYGLNGANLGTDPTFAEIGKEMDVSAERARRLVRSGERKLKELSPEKKERLPLPVWSEYRGRSSAKERQRPAWEDHVLARVDRDLAEKREREERERPGVDAWFSTAAVRSRDPRHKLDRNRPMSRLCVEGSVELKEVA